MGNRRVVTVPELTAKITVKTDLNKHEVASQVGLALGVTFDPDKEGLYEEIEALVAYAVGHIFGIFESKNEGSSNSSIRDIFLDLIPDLYPTDLGLRLSECNVVDLDVDDYLVALLRKKTGLPFERSRPINLSTDTEIQL